MSDRLETVRRLREMREWECRVELGMASRRVERAESAVNAARHARAARRVAAQSLAELRLGHVTAVGLQHEFDDAADELVQQRAARDEAVRNWRAARADLRAVERLLERRQEAAVVETRRKEQREMDDLALLADGNRR